MFIFELNNGFINKLILGLMKRTLLILSLFALTSVSAQKRMKDYSNILKSKNIYEINAFLRDAHPDDPKRSILKPRVMDMMKEYIKNALPGDQRVKEMQEMLALLKKRPSTKLTFDELNERIRQKQIALYREELAKASNPNYYKEIAENMAQASAAGVSTAAAAGLAGMSKDEEEEYNTLIKINPIEHKNKTVKLLNSLFDNDPNSKEAIVMIKNNSDCNMIMRMEGIGYQKYRLAVPAHTEHSIVLPKGDYLFSSVVCGAQYASQKTIDKAIMVSLSNPGQ